jgi:hypothetical protein
MAWRMAVSASSNRPACSYSSVSGSSNSAGTNASAASGSTRSRGDGLLQRRDARRGVARSGGHRRGQLVFDALDLVCEVYRHGPIMPSGMC